MAFNRHAAQRYLEEENEARIENLLEKTRALGDIAGEISVEIRDSCKELDDIVRFFIVLLFFRG